MQWQVCGYINKNIIYDIINKSLYRMVNIKYWHLQQIKNNNKIPQWQLKQTHTSLQRNTKPSTGVVECSASGSFYYVKLEQGRTWNTKKYYILFKKKNNYKKYYKKCYKHIHIGLHVHLRKYTHIKRLILIIQLTT